MKYGAYCTAVAQSPELHRTLRGSASKISAWRLKAQTRPQSDSGTRTVRWWCEIPGNPVRIICNTSTNLRAANAATTTAQTAPTFMIASVQPAKVGYRDSPSEPSSGIGTVRRYPVRLSGSVKVCSIKNRAAEAAPFFGKRLRRL
jgi:hypothetical protein